MKRVLALFVFFMFVLAACGDDDLDRDIIDDIIDDVIDQETITIVFDSQGGSAVSNMTIATDATSINLPTSEREGYTFLGWYLDEDLSDPFVLEAILAEQSVTVYASWEAVVVDMIMVSFETFGGSSVDAQSIETGTLPDAVSDPTRNDDLFTGWYVDADLTEPYDFDVALEEDTTLYASWLVSHEVTFMVDGSVYETAVVSEGTSEYFPAEPSKTGYSFAGWYADANMNTAVGNSYTVDSDLTLYAGFTVNAYTVNYEMYDAGTDTEMFDFGEEITLIDDPEVEGYTFIGWYVDAAWNQAFDMELMPAEDINLYARFVEDSQVYTVDFIVDDAIYVTAIVVAGEFVDLPDAPTVEGYQFDGWYVDGAMLTAEDAIYESVMVFAVFSPLEFTIAFETGEGSVVDSITAEYGASIEAPDAPTRTGYVFAGWYADSDLTEPFMFDEMPLEGAVLYARWIEEGQALTLFDIITLQIDTAEIANVTVVFSEYWADEDVYISLIRDDTAALFVFGDFGFNVGDVVSFDATLFYEGNVPIVGYAENIEVIDTGVAVTYAYQEISIEALIDLDSTDPLMVGVFYKVTGFMMLEDYPALFDITNEQFYPLINVLMSDLYDENFEALAHGYVSFGFMLMPTVEDDVLLIYLEDVYPIETVDVSTEEKLALVEDLLKEILSMWQVEPGFGLEIPPFEPFFGTEITFTAIGENADLYDADSDTFAVVTEPTVITFEFTLSLDGETATFVIEYMLEPLSVTALDELYLVEFAYIYATVILVQGDYVVLATEDGLVGAFNYGGFVVEEGYRYLLEVSVYPQGPMVELGILNVVDEGELHAVDVLYLEIDDDMLYSWGDNNFTGFVMELEGVLFASNDWQHPYMLFTGESIIYLHAQTPEARDFYDALIGEVVTLDAAIIGNRTYIDGAFVGILLDEDTVSSRAMTVQERFAFVESVLVSIFETATFRPNKAYGLPNRDDDFDVLISYVIDPNDAGAASIEDLGAFYELMFTAEAAVSIEITLSYETETHTFEVIVESEDYTISTIQDAFALEEGSRVTLEVKRVAETMYYNYIFIDDTGTVLIDGYSINVWIPLNTRVILTGEIVERDGVYWLENVIVEEMEAIDAVDLGEATQVDFDVYAGYDEYYEGIEYIEVTGYLQANSDSFGQLALWDEAREQFIILGLDPEMSSYLFNFYDEEVTLRGYFVLDDGGFVVLAVTERVETEVVATFGEMQYLDAGTRVRVDGYLLFYYDGLAYMIDGTGMIPIYGMDETFAMNRIGENLVFYANLIDVEGVLMFDVANSIFIDRGADSIEPYLPFTLTTTIADLYNFQSNDMLNQGFIYATSGTVSLDEGQYYLEDGAFSFLVIDPYDVIDLESNVGVHINVSILITYSVAPNGDLVVMIVPE